ncbi:MAG: glycosyltransferase [Planctomycetota bacterium]|jgi:glycosyltransferase involved in cell wall biosynthesis
MRLLHVIPDLDPAFGGPQMVVTRLAAAQAGLGHEVGILAHATPDAEDRIDAALAAVPGFDRVAVDWLPAAKGVEKVTARGGRRRAAAVVPGLDFVHVHCVWEPLLCATAAVARGHGVPYAVVPHGMLDPWCLARSRLKKKVALALTVRPMLAGAAFLHVLNDDERRLIEPLGLGVPAHVIPNGVFLDELEPAPDAGTFRAAHPELDGQPYILFLGRLHHKKGLDILADAFVETASAHPDVQLVVAGPDHGARAPFEQRVAAAGLAGRVHVVGPLYGADKRAALADATCFCLPSRQEGFSVAITEALACGVPVVVSEPCHFPEVAEVGAGEVVPLSAEAVAAALGRVVTDADRRGRMREAGRRLVRERYTWPTIAAQTIAAYAETRAGT